jgi:hypothetical protein
VNFDFARLNSMPWLPSESIATWSGALSSSASRLRTVYLDNLHGVCSSIRPQTARSTKSFNS